MGSSKSRVESTERTFDFLSVDRCFKLAYPHSLAEHSEKLVMLKRLYLEKFKRGGKDAGITIDELNKLLKRLEG